MRTMLIVTIVGCIAGCAPTPPQLHHSSQLRPGTAYFCMASDGTLARELFDASGGVTCPAPARFISQPFCESVPAAPRDNLGYYRARADAARDGALHGDTFEGQPFCAVQLRGPPRPSHIESSESLRPLRPYFFGLR